MLENIDINTLTKMIRESNTYLIDVREPEEFMENRIEGAINLDIDNIDNIINIIPNKNNKIIVCCARGIRSIAAGERICELGYKSVYNLDGGMSVFNKKAE